MSRSWRRRPAPQPTTEFRENGLLVTTTALQLEPTCHMNGRRRVYRLLVPYNVSLYFDGGYLFISVPQWFTTDFATFPIIAQIVLGNRDAPGVQEASVIHDYLCKLKMPATVANAFMLAILSVFKVPRWKRGLIFFGLTYFGYRSPLLRFIQRTTAYYRKWFPH